jgi:uncharacterized membrane protein
MKETLIGLVQDHFSLPVATVLIAMMPVLELRGALPAAILGGMPLWQAYLLAVLGNMIPVPIILLLLDPVTRFIRRWERGDRFVEWLFNRTRLKGKNIEKYEMWGLMVFVAIPFPATGAWTGSMAGFLFGLKNYKILAACFAGVCIAGVIMTLLSVFARETFIMFFGHGGEVAPH